MMRIAQRSLQSLPLLGVLTLLRFLPTLADAPLRGTWPLPWRLDALTLVFLLSLSFAVAAVPLRPRDTLRALGTLALLLPALLTDQIIVLPLALVGVSLLLHNWRWLAAAGVLELAVALLGARLNTSWADPQTLMLTSPLFLLLLAACCIGLNCYPISLMHERPDLLRLALQSVWLLPLLRVIAWGPWNSGWALATLLLGAATTLWCGATALWTENRTIRTERIAGIWLGMALACVGLLTPVGVASTLWQVLGYSVSLALLTQQHRLSLWAAPVPPSIAFVASWLALGAVAASGAFLLSGVFWIASIAGGLAIMYESRLATHPQATPTHGASSRVPQIPRSLAAVRQGLPKVGAGFLVLISLVLGLLAPVVLRWLIVPAVDQLQGGLTPFGLLTIWPWVGLAALDAGQRRVAVLPSIAVGVLALVVAALVWLLARLGGVLNAPSHDVDAEPDRLPDWWSLIRRRVWWAGGRKHRG